MPADGGLRDGILYGEVIYYPAWMYALIAGLISLYVAIIIGAAAEGMKLNATLYTFIAVMLVLTLVNFWRLEFAITDSQVVFGFGLLKKRFPRELVTSCERYELKFSNYLGYGIRWGLDRTIAYNTRNGPGVKLVVEGCRKPYVISVRDPDRVCSLLSLRPGGTTHLT